MQNKTPGIIIVGAPECPLCFNRMKEVINKQGRFYVCLKDTCMVSISAADPACGHWRDKDTKGPPCVRCGTPMRMFFRTVDNFMVCQCPKCTEEGHLVEVRRGKVKDMNPNTVWHATEEECQ
jgi:hypothetical protein